MSWSILIDFEVPAWGEFDAGPQTLAGGGSAGA